MSVILKGVEMPERCGQCFLRVGNCKQRIYMEQRPKNCPLVKLPPHGRLGDLDELYKVANMADDFGADTLDMLKLIADTPTVIEAEGETE